MLKLTPNPTFKADVAIPTPTGEVTIKVEFRHKGRAELEEWLKSTVGEDNEVLRKDNEALAEVIENWSGVDEKYSTDTLNKLLDAYPASGKALIGAYLPALLEGRRKN